MSPENKNQNQSPSVNLKDTPYPYSSILEAGYTPGAQSSASSPTAKPTYVYRPGVKGDLAPSYPSSLPPAPSLNYVEQAKNHSSKSKPKQFALPPRVKYLLVQLQRSYQKNQRAILTIAGSVIGLFVIIGITIGIINLISSLNQPAPVAVEEVEEEERNVELTPAAENTPLEPGEVTVTIGNQPVTFTAAYLVDGIEATIGSGEYKSSTNDQNVFLVVNGGSLNISGTVKISKTGKNRDDRSETSLLGTNAAIVVIGENSHVNLSGTTITTDDDGADAIVALNSGTASIASGMITSTALASRGLVALAGGNIEANSVVIKTSGKSSPALVSGIPTHESVPDIAKNLISSPHGTIVASKMSLTTGRLGSPLIYAAGDLTVMESRGTASSAQIAILDGKNSLILTGNNFTASGTGIKQNIDNAGIFAFSSLQDPAKREATLTIDYTNLTLSSNASLYNSTPLLFATNTALSGTIANSTLSFSQQSVLVKAAGSSGWGQSGENGATVNLILDNNTLTNTEVNSDSLSHIGL